MGIRLRRAWVAPVGFACVVALVAAGCGGGGGSSATDGKVSGDANTVNSGKPVGGGAVTYSITAPISNWNVLNSGGATYSVIDVNGVIAPRAFVVQPDGSVAMNEELLTRAEKVADSPHTVEYEFAEKATWSDGEPITADDLIYTWHALDPRHCPKCQASNTAGYDRIKSIKASDDGRKATVVFDQPYVDWQALFSPFLPAHVAAKYGDLDTAAGLAKSFNDGLATNVPKWSAGPFRVQEFTEDGSVVMVRNEKWFGPKPNLEKLVFRLITDVAQQPTSLANHEVDVIYPTPQVDIVQQVEELPGVKYQVSPAFQNHFLRVNMNAPPLKDKALRKAIFHAVDVKQIIAKTIGQFDKTAKQALANIFAQGNAGYTDAVSKYDYGIGDAEMAKQTLKDAGYSGIGEKLVDHDGKAVPPLRIIVPSGGKLINNEAQLVKAALQPLGIEVTIGAVANQVDAINEGNWAFSLGTVTKSPFSATDNIAYYLSCPKGVRFCRFNLANYGNPEVDKLLKSALAQTSSKAAIEKLRQADDLIAGDYASLPLYQNRTFLAYDAKLANVRDNSLEFPTYNSTQWGWLERE